MSLLPRPLADLLILIYCPECGQRVHQMPWTLEILMHSVPPRGGVCAASGEAVGVVLSLPDHLLSRPRGYN